MILFKPIKKPLDCQLKLKLNGKILYQTSLVKYLGIKMDQYLNWQDHINNIAIKLNKAMQCYTKLDNLLMRKL